MSVHRATAGSGAVKAQEMRFTASPAALMIPRMRKRLAPLLFAALLAAGCAQKQSPIVGAWRSSIQFESGAFAAIHDLEFMYVFNAGGTLTESSNYDAAPPVPPAYGVWREIGPHEFEAKYEYFATAPAEASEFEKAAVWLPAGRGLFTETITLADDGRSFTSTLRYEPLDAKGKPADGGGTAKGQAVRIGH